MRCKSLAGTICYATEGIRGLSRDIIESSLWFNEYPSQVSEGTGSEHKTTEEPVAVPGPGLRCQARRAG